MRSTRTFGSKRGSFVFAVWPSSPYVGSRFCTAGIQRHVKASLFMESLKRPYAQVSHLLESLLYLARVGDSPWGAWGYFLNSSFLDVQWSTL